MRGPGDRPAGALQGRSPLQPRQDRFQHAVHISVDLRRCRTEQSDSPAHVGTVLASRRDGALRRSNGSRHRAPQQVFLRGKRSRRNRHRSAERICTRREDGFEAAAKLDARLGSGLGAAHANPEVAARARNPPLTAGPARPTPLPAFAGRGDLLCRQLMHSRLRAHGFGELGEVLAVKQITWPTRPISANRRGASSARKWSNVSMMSSAIAPARLLWAARRRQAARAAGC